MKKQITGLFLLIFAKLTFAVSVVDDTGVTLILDEPARRIITLAPSLTELVFEAGAGDNLVATVEFSDYPQRARQVPRVGNFDKLLIEKLISYKPDLVISWSSAGNSKQIPQLKKFNIPVYISEPHEFSDIARTLRNLGKLTGTEKTAEQAATQFENKLASLAEQNKSKPRVNVFFQIWHKPIYTVNREHVISKVMDLCGLNNLFADAAILAPKVTHESVINKNPQMIISGGMAEARPEWLDTWKDWSQITAVQKQNLYWIHPDLITRQSPRILQGVEIMCQQADEARKKLELEQTKSR